MQTIDIEHQIRVLAERFARNLQIRTTNRIKEMDRDDRSHLLIYRVLGVTDEEGRLIDIYQNKGRFLYNAAGRFLEQAAKLCFKNKYPDSDPVRIPNTKASRPKTFEIDCLIGTDAIEIKWRDATTDGDHIRKEHARIQTIADAGFTPVRVMFYYPNRTQAIQIQETLATLYTGVNGEYYFGNSAWSYVHTRTGINLLAILEILAGENANKS